MKSLNKTQKVLPLLLVIVMVIPAFAGCSSKSNQTTDDGIGQNISDTQQDDSVVVDENGNTFVGVNTDSGDQSHNSNGLGNGVSINTLANNENLTPNNNDGYGSFLGNAPKGKYNEGVVLIKSNNKISKTTLTQNGLVSAEPLYKGSKWYYATVREGLTTADTVEKLTENKVFDAVDYDYIMGVDAVAASVDVTTNPDFEKSKHFGPHGIQQGWTHINDHGRHPGGSSDVIVAVIDTGVDYNHLDLRNNIWVNSAEIPDNGKDDDGNGYIDDVNGWNCVGNNNKPLDDNGHGTHVAGIIAAENNKIGGVGVAYNCKIMPIKAGNSSGYFNNSDIAEAIQYAYMNGATVINMSFGGSSISMAVEDALESAYNSCVLVAAAGNDGLCNNLAHEDKHEVGVSYPAALPYVIGVMSVNSNGTAVSGFSNYDDTPYDSVEYEVYAVGETIPSTWPGNKYATLQGTSMAAPSVSGIAALLRSYYSDREVYSTKFIQSQIVNTGTLYPYNSIIEKNDDAHSIANVYEALTQLPKPEVNLYDYKIDDSTSVHANNNGNGVIDAGETVRLYVSLFNRGGVATNVTVTADVIRNKDLNIVDEYFTIKNPTMQFSDIGTYSVRDSESSGTYFEIEVSADCPNDYLTDFNIHFTYKNGMDSEDTTLYTDDGEQKATFNVSRGFHLPAVITEDTVYTADRLYIVGEDVVIPEGVTVTFEEGCEIQFYDDRECYNSPSVKVYGTLNFNGTKENMINIAPNERHNAFLCHFRNYGVSNFNYVSAINIVLSDAGRMNTTNIAISTLSNSILTLEGQELIGSTCVYVYSQGSITKSLFDLDAGFDFYYDNYLEFPVITGRVLKNNIILASTHSTKWIRAYENYENNLYIANGGELHIYSTASNNIFATIDATSVETLATIYSANNVKNSFYS